MDCKEKSDDELPGEDEKDNFCESNASLVSSSDGGVLAEGEDETSSESNMSGDSPVCDLGLVERLLRTHQIWFLPGIQRSGAVHLLQGKEEGVSNTMVYIYMSTSLFPHSKVRWNLRFSRVKQYF